MARTDPIPPPQSLPGPPKEPVPRARHPPVRWWRNGAAIALFPGAGLKLGREFSGVGGCRGPRVGAQHVRREMPSTSAARLWFQAQDSSASRMRVRSAARAGFAGASAVLATSTSATGPGGSGPPQASRPAGGRGRSRRPRTGPGPDRSRSRARGCCRANGSARASSTPPPKSRAAGGRSHGCRHEKRIDQAADLAAAPAKRRDLHLHARARRCSRSPRNRPAATSASRSRLLVARKRTAGRPPCTPAPRRRHGPATPEPPRAERRPRRAGAIRPSQASTISASPRSITAGSPPLQRSVAKGLEARDES